MTREIRRIAPLRAANIVGTLYFLFLGAFSLLIVPLVGEIPVDPNLPTEQQQLLRSSTRWLLLAYPFVGGVFSWLFALAGAASYNRVAPRIGGFTVELASPDPEARPTG